MYMLYSLLFLNNNMQFSFIEITKSLITWYKIHFAGIWIRDIRFKSNIQMTQVNKIVKNLESKKLIKAVKSVAVSIIGNL